MDSGKLEAALHSEESKAESTDLKGNWGPPCEGLRLSLRFDKAEYVVGEPITAKILLRNVSDRDIDYRWDLTEWYWPFEVISPQGNKLNDLLPARPNAGTVTRTVYVRTQRRLSFRLDPHFDLRTPGDYGVSVSTLVASSKRGGGVHVSSGVARIRIVPRGTKPDDRPPQDRSSTAAFNLLPSPDTPKSP